MKRLLLILSLVFTTLSLAAQNQQDFAGQFMRLYGKTTSLECSTVSPTMMGKMMKEVPADKQNHVRQVLTRVKSIRVVSNSKSSETSDLTDKAIDLVTQNSQRYQAYGATTTKRGVWMRKKGNAIVEIVVVNGTSPSRLHIVNLTGNMDDDFLDELLKM